MVSGASIGLTETERAHERLREYARAVEGLEDIVTVVDRDYRFVFANQAFLRRREVPRERVIGRLIEDIIGVELFESVVRENLDRAFRGETIRYETAIDYPKLGKSDVTANYLPLEGPTGIDRVVCIIRDLTETRQAEVALKNSEYQMAVAQHLAHVGSWNWNLRTEELNWSDELYHIFSVPSQTFVPSYDNYVSLIHPEDRHPTIRRIQECIETGKSFSADERIIWPNGEERTLHSHGQLIRDTEGNPVAMVGACQDVTDARRAREALRQADLEYREIFTNAPVGIYRSLRDGTIITANAALAGMLGYDSVADLLGVKFGSDVYFDSSEREILIKRFDDRRQPFDSEVKWKRKDGEPIWVQLSVHALTKLDGHTECFEGFVRDITERRRSEEARRVAEQKYRDIFENAVEGIFQSTPDGRYLAANPALARMHGFDSPEDLMRERTDISRAYTDPKRRDAFKKLMESEGFVRGFEFQLSRKDGEQIWASVNARVVRDEQGRTLYYEGTGLDITERKQAQAQLEASEERYRDLVENSHELIGTHDLNGLILSANQATASALGFPLDAVVGKNIRDFLAPGSAGLFDEYMERVRVEGGTGGLMMMITSSGERRIWEYYNSLRTEGVAEPIVRGIARDITEQRLAEKALRESEERYRELFENSRDAIYVHDLGGRYVSVNRAAELLSGFDRQQILGKHYSNFIAPRNLKNARENFCRKLDAPIETSYEAEVVCKNGHRIPVEISSRMIYRDGQAVGVQGIARDITERKRAQQTLQNYSRRLMEVQEAERQNLSRELHDEIGQALTAIRINLEWMRRSGIATPEALPRIDESIDAVDDAVRRVRELALELRPSLLDDLGLASALRWFVDRFAVRTGINAQVVGDIQRTNHIPYEIETAAFRIVQEALTNVARHSFATRVSIDISQRNGELHLEVYDNGIGFDSDTVLNGKSSAAALGLRGMQERALAVNGDIDIISQPRAGTHILLALPLAAN